MNNSVPRRFPAIFLAAFLGAASLAAAATITVNSTADVAATNGQCTLREAINNANGNSDTTGGDCVAGSGADTIQFNLGTGTPTITVTSALPSLNEAVTINGNTGGATRVELNGGGVSANGLFLDGNGNTIKNLVINRFAGDGITLNTSNNNTIQGNFIGTNAAGTTSTGFGNSGSGIRVLASQSNTIGGTTGTTPGGSCTGVCNLISGNAPGGLTAGIYLDASGPGGSSSNTIQGNFIGTDVTGTIALGNASGIRTFNPGNTNQIGGTAPGAGNVISGNGTGIMIAFGGAPNSVIQGNLIGTNSAGNAVIGNTYGIQFLSSNGQGVVIGGTAVGAGNIISGNGRAGIYGGLNNGTIQGNFVGTDVTGTLNLGNGYDNGGGSGLEALGGISLLAGSSGNTIGGTAPGAPNVVAFNRGAGVRLGGDNFSGASGGANPIRANSIYLNNGLGIGLSDGGGVNGTPLPNDDDDPDTGANNRQNYPVLSTVSATAGVITVTGTLNSLPSTTFTIDFYASENQDASGKGEGETYLGSQSVTTNASGDATISFNYTVIPGQPFTTATATNAGTNDTSEFSNAVLLAVNPGTFVFSSATYSVVENAGVATITVNRANGSTGTACVNYATSNGTASAGSDYATATGQLCFADGVTSKTFNVTITSDAAPEPNETINLTLSNPTNGSALGFQSVATLTIINDDSFVTFVVNNVADTDDGACTAVGTGNGCTLREAINAANATAGQDSITFDIGSTPTITVTSALPGINAPVFIDGKTGGATRVEINGNNVSASGLTVNSSGSRSVIRRLVINRFNGSGLNLTTSGNNVIEGNYIGTDSSGTVDLGNTGSGITFAASSNNLIGGTTDTTPGGSCTGACNLISGNNGAGISADALGGTANANVIQGNYIGTDVTGTLDLGNSGRGITFLNAVYNTQIGGTSAAARNLISGNNDIGVFMSAAGTTGNVIQGNYIGVNTTATAKLGNVIGVTLFFTATGNTIGGTATGAGNVISGNTLAGIEIITNGGPPNSPPNNNVVQGNFIGTDPTGTLDLGNGTSGQAAQNPVGGIVLAQGVFNNQIGGTAPGAGNWIAFNYGAGIRLGAYTGAVAAGPGNAILNNSIYSNNGLGIALGDGPGLLLTPLLNDPSDPDTGANNRQNYPLLTVPASSGGTVTVTGSLNSLAATTFLIQFYVSSTPDISTNGEGETFVGSQTVSTDGSGNAPISFGYSSVSGKQVISATATNVATGDTSEFSNHVIDPTASTTPTPTPTASPAVTPIAAPTPTPTPTPATPTPTPTPATPTPTPTPATPTPTPATPTPTPATPTPTPATPTPTPATPTPTPATPTPTPATPTPTPATPTPTPTPATPTPTPATPTPTPATPTPTPATPTPTPATPTPTPATPTPTPATPTPTPATPTPTPATPTPTPATPTPTPATPTPTPTPATPTPTPATPTPTPATPTPTPATPTPTPATPTPTPATPTPTPATPTPTPATPTPTPATPTPTPATPTPTPATPTPTPATPTPTPATPTPTPATPTPTPTPATPTPTPATPTPTPATPTPTPATPTPTPATPTPTPATPTPTPATPTPTPATPTPTPATPTPTPATPTPTPATPTPTPATPTPTPATPTPTPATPTPTPATPTPTPATPTPTPTPATPTPTPATPTPTPTVAPATPTPAPSPTASPSATPPLVTQAINLSTRMRVQTGDGVGVGGFIITGTAPKDVIVRAIGPSLIHFGVPNVLADPVLELHGPGTFAVITNNNWRENQEDEIQATGIPPTNDLESAIVATLNPGAYTAIVRGNGNTSGVGLVEVYDLNQGAGSKLGNLSTRALVSTGDDIVIAGFLLSDAAASDRVIVRGIGPSLAPAMFPLSAVLADPALELRDSNGTLIVSNNDWQDNAVQAAEITAAGLAPTNNLEAGIAATLPPGLYTALLSGLNSGTGIGLVEVYDLGP